MYYRTSTVVTNKKMRIKDQKIERFLEELASRSPTPGGGAVAALTGTIAASLVEMVVNLTKTKEIKNLKTKVLKNLRIDLLKLADEDCKAFDEVMVTYKSKDKEEIKRALQKAIDVPEKTMLLSNEVLKLAKIVLKKGNKNTFSDAKTAIYLAQAAIKSAGENIRINQQSLAALA